LRVIKTTHLDISCRTKNYSSWTALTRRTQTRRSRLEITLDVLRIIKNGERKPTRIMNAANLTYRGLKEALNVLLSQNLIRENYLTSRGRKRDRRTHIEYEITSEGINMLRNMKELDDLMTLEFQSAIT
jgi:predicted transcriptional regulator